MLHYIPEQDHGIYFQPLFDSPRLWPFIIPIVGGGPGSCSYGWGVRLRGLAYKTF